jgi:PKD repeat protein
LRLYGRFDWFCEGQELNGCAIESSEASTAALFDSDMLSAQNYCWNFSDGSLPSLGQTITHSFADNGTYSAILIVTDSNGSSSTQTFSVTVNNVSIALELTG